jgi:hypothetical protein
MGILSLLLFDAVFYSRSSASDASRTTFLALTLNFLFNVVSRPSFTVPISANDDRVKSIEWSFSPSNDCIEPRELVIAFPCVASRPFAVRFSPISVIRVNQW